MKTVQVRVINFKYSLPPQQKYYTTQYEELVFSSLKLERTNSQ